MASECLARLGLQCRAKPCPQCFVPPWTSLWLLSGSSRSTELLEGGGGMSGRCRDTRMVTQCPAVGTIPDTAATARPLAVYLGLESLSQAPWDFSLRNALGSCTILYNPTAASGPFCVSAVCCPVLCLPGAHSLLPFGRADFTSSPGVCMVIKDLTASISLVHLQCSH